MSRFTNPDFIRSLLENIERDYQEDFNNLKEERRKKVKAVQSLCPHNIEEPIDDSWEHPHNGDYIRDIKCKTCGESL